MKSHEGIFAYKCEHCGKGFSLRTTYNTHLFTHSDYRPYKCEICSYTFAHKSYYEVKFNYCETILI